MRDDRDKWLPIGQHEYPINLPGATLSVPDISRQTLISGAQVLEQIKQPLIGWPDIADVQSYAITLRRDRVLLVNDSKEPDGWNEELNWAVSDVSDAYSVIDIHGEQALSLLMRGTELSLSAPSRSAARRMFGLDVILYRITAYTFSQNLL